MLSSKAFDPDQYVASSLAGSSQQDVQNFYQSLQDLQSSTSKDLQANVFNNFASFVSLSHEISSLTSDLTQLSSLLTQYSNITHSFTTAIQKDDGDSIYRTRKAQNRSSIADLEQIYAGHLQELWHLVEGSQKFLPAAPGRHIVKESLNWIELNAATWKPMRPVHLILLNDHLLVAAKKRGKSASLNSQKSVADRCWGLADIELRELSGEGGKSMDSRGAIQVVRGRDVAVYAPENGSVSECSAFVKAFNRASNDLYNRRTQVEVSSNGICPF
jgi:exocyst complex component 8